MPSIPTVAVPVAKQAVTVWWITGRLNTGGDMTNLLI
jgi:hypothetical protein